MEQEEEADRENDASDEEVFEFMDEEDEF